MGKETATLVAAVIAACAALTTTALSGWRQYDIEKEKWHQARQDETDRAVRVAIADLGKQLASGIHAIGWLTWKAKYAPDTLATEDVIAYEKEVKTLFPNLVSAHLLVVALDRARCAIITSLVDRLLALDGEAALAGVKLKTARVEGLMMLQGCYDESRVLKKELHGSLSSAMYSVGAASSEGSRLTR